MAAYVLACDEADVDLVAGTCAAPYYIEQASVIPTLTIDGAAQIGAACALLFAIAWVFRRVGKSITTIW